MSKKKGASRSAMTLKDFHGGSIPSDLPLPSAPGMTVDRSTYERQGSGTWMNPTLGRGFGTDRSGFLRQSSGGMRTFEDKASYFPNPANIGRNYDEDERKPFESRPRSSHSSDRFDDHAAGYKETRARGAGYSSSERYSFDDQGSYGGSHSNFASEARSSSGNLERFMPSQSTGGNNGFESEVYVHEDFGMIPVGPPPARAALSQDQYQRRNQSAVPYQRDSADSSFDQQSSYAQQYAAQPQVATSPPRSWRNPAQQAQGSYTSSGPQGASLDSPANIWTSKREGDVQRPVSESAHGDNHQVSAPWRFQSMSGRITETRAMDKVNSGRWQSDSSRSPAAAERQFTTGGQSALQKLSGGLEYAQVDNGVGRYEPRGIARGEGLQSDAEAYRHRSVEDDRSARSDSERLDKFVAHNSLEPERVTAFVSSRSPRPSTESIRLSYPDSRGLSSMDDGRPEPIDQSKSGYRDYGRAGVASGQGSGSGRFSSLDRSKYESGDASSPADSGSRLYSENGRASSVESGREFSGDQAAEVIVRPKLKLLPRTKPLEITSSVEKDTAYEEGGKRTQGQVDEQKMPDASVVETKRLLTSEGSDIHEENDEDARRVERPKLMLKPRSNVTEAETEEGSQKGRNAVFGGARPREMVLKDRGVDEILIVSQDTTPATASLSTNSSRKWEQGNDGTRIAKGDYRAEDKQDSWRSEKAFERQGSHRQESRHASDRRWDAEKDNHLDQERADGPRSNRLELEKLDNRREGENRRDIDKQESWRRPAEPPASIVGSKIPGPTSSLLLDPAPRGVSGRSTYSGASAAELAQAFSRSASFGSNTRGINNSLRSPLSPLPKSGIQGFSLGHGNGIIGHHSGPEAPFSRLADASSPPFSTSGVDYLSGLEQTNYFGSGKLGGFGSGDLNRGSSFGRQDSGCDHIEENDDFPGKRALPVRQRDNYFD